MRHICLDIETTGLDPKSEHRTIEIACIEMINLVKTDKFFHCYVNPKRDVPFEAFKIHNISTEFLQDKPYFENIATEFLDFIGDSTLVIHNAPFDTKFLNFELEANGFRNLAEKNKIVDTLVMARTKFPGGQNSLDALCRRFNIDSSKRTYHGALVDTDLLCQIFVELMGGAQTELMNSNEESRTFNNSLNKSKFTTQIDSENSPYKNLPIRDFSPDNQQLEEHYQFIKKNLKKNFWNYE